MGTKSYSQAGIVSVSVGAVSRRRSGEPSRLRSVRALLSRDVHRSLDQMVVRRSALRIRQSLCSLLPCQRLLARIQEASYLPGMKMSEFWRSCLVSCGTSVFVFL